MKYIIDSYNNVILCSNTIIHSDVGRQMYGKAVSAGFVRFEDSSYLENQTTAHCYGESISLELKSREEDSAIINTFLNLPHK